MQRTVGDGLYLFSDFHDADKVAIADEEGFCTVVMVRCVLGDTYRLKQADASTFDPPAANNNPSPLPSVNPLTQQQYNSLWLSVDEGGDQVNTMLKVVCVL